MKFGKIVVWAVMLRSLSRWSVTTTGTLSELKTPECPSYDREFKMRKQKTAEFIRP